MMRLVAVAGAAALMALAVACGGSSSSPKKLGDLTVNEHGTKDVTGASSFALEADSFYFEPTYLKGTPGQKLKVTVTNATSGTLHNFSAPALRIDKDIQAKANVDVDLTFPQSGVLLFLCKYHTGSGMNGELLAGNATPQAASASAAAPDVPAVPVGGGGGAAPPAAAANLKSADNATLGKIVTDSAGKTLYINRNDVANSGKSTVSGNTLTVWPVFSVPGTPTKTSDLTGSIDVITRDDGAKQVTYKGMPLYYFARDNAPGDTNGQGIGNVWFAATP